MNAHVAAPPRSETDWRLVLIGLVLVSAVYVWWRLGSGWIPYDDGTVAQSAERVLQGQLPHRDFDELYTGGLAWVNAAGFRLLGTNLWTLRVVLFAVFLAWLPTLFYIASRFARPLAAAGVVLLAVVWSLPNYPVAMASWYNLFLATFGIAALFRYLEVGHRRWLMTAGLAGGLSFLVKMIGLYYVAGVLLFLVFHAHTLSRSTGDTRRGRTYAVFVSISLLLFIAFLYSVVRRQLYATEFVQFVIPGVFVAALLIRNEWTQPAGASRARFAVLARLLVPFLAAVALPVALYLVPYARDGALGALVNGVFVVPMRRFSVVSFPAPPLTTMLALVPFAALVIWGRRTAGATRRRETTLLAVALALLVLVSGQNDPLYRMVWYAVRNLPAVLAVSGVLLLSRDADAGTRTPLLRAQTMLLLAVTALCSLVQLPFSAPNYFCYVAPLVVLTTLALYQFLKPAGAVPGVLVAFFIAFAVLRVNSSPLYSMGVADPPPLQMTTLALDRGGIEVPRLDAATYEELVPLLRARAHGDYTWASPDAPEIYFLSGLKNPTRTFFEMFQDSTKANEGVLRALDAHGVTAIVLNAQPSFSPFITRGMFVQLASRYPHAQNVGPFQLRWRE